MTPTDPAALAALLRELASFYAKHTANAYPNDIGYRALAAAAALERPEGRTPTPDRASLRGAIQRRTKPVCDCPPHSVCNCADTETQSPRKAHWAELSPDTRQLIRDVRAAIRGPYRLTNAQIVAALGTRSPTRRGTKAYKALINAIAKGADIPAVPCRTRALPPASDKND